MQGRAETTVPKPTRARAPAPVSRCGWSRQPRTRTTPTPACHAPYRRGGFEAPYRRERADLLPSTGNRQPHKRPHGPRIVGAREAGLSALSRAAEADAEVGKVPEQMWVDAGLSPTRACAAGRQRHWTPSWPMRLPLGCTARSSRAGGREACWSKASVPSACVSLPSRAGRLIPSARLPLLASPAAPCAPQARPAFFFG